ncbi:SDR family oxidoreductase [Mycolicibacterium houstonense]|uniref:SDR family oxidoreductase n=1 Tax=Mycolicibacterium houstonense TaxID=146021 RepID=UPI000830E58E|nr:SDR family oxidoreductase [Mycolicibacterium houstonense]
MNPRKVAITGGARGIGRATAAIFQAVGADVAIGDLDGDHCGEVAAQLGSSVTGLPLDVTDPASFADFLDAARVAMGGLDVLVNNAGIMPTGAFLDEDEAMTDRLIAINLRGVITGTRLAANRFRQQGQGGSIVNVASLAGLFGAPAIATYTATKAAVVTLTESLAKEFSGSGIHVCVVLPGVVRTELSGGAHYPRWMERVAAVEPDDVAHAIRAAVTVERTRVSVPRSLETVVAVRNLLPNSLSWRLDRLVGLDSAFTQADPAARARYHQRLSGSLDDAV